VSEHSLLYFIDTNIFIYSVGQDHPVKAHCVAVIQKIRDGKIKAVVSTEIIQEILYRFQAMGELPYGIRLAREVILVSSQILPVTERDLSLAMEILESCPQIETRDSFHYDGAIGWGRSFEDVRVHALLFEEAGIADLMSQGTDSFFDGIGKMFLCWKDTGKIYRQFLEIEI